MCEASAYMLNGDREELILDSVDVVEPINEDEYLLISIFGEQKTIRGSIKRMNLVNHKIVFEAYNTHSNQ